jgi:hypothetical protein
MNQFNKNNCKLIDWRVFDFIEEDVLSLDTEPINVPRGMWMGYYFFMDSN